MPRVLPGRMTHRHDGELVVFLIGMRVNQWWRPDQWLPVFGAMGPMLTELSRDTESGLAGFRLTIGADGPVLVQYWTSLEKLYAYASAPSSAHRPAWSSFNARARKAPGAVGIWHETFVVERAESMYVGMPTRGLAAATESIVVDRSSHTARARAAAGQTRAS
ncbi:hypothetical protein B7R22_07620 [Subtercola boreus]|uniref:DUF4188 domain-containing protein n=1 Tax=Subtercola boreus TaxID=120213 RepID=A0A3E0VY20_9MICO|nr:DUF4188 domain-containing protein [Subtercola boreus]RFA14994.1 hypothetical protein B7R22_07620 [Subtercola boreus]